jgi:hypothetical protein
MVYGWQRKITTGLDGQLEAALRGAPKESP